MKRQDDIIKLISKNLNRISKSIFFLSPNKEKNYSILLKAYKEILSVSEVLREYLANIKLNKTEIVTDNKIENPLSIQIKKIIFNDYFVYEISIPIILPKEKNQTNKKLFQISLKNAITTYKAKYNDIVKISEPIVIFENQFTKSKKGVGLKDTDNYCISEFLNYLQSFFIEDDRTATTVVRNISKAADNKTTIIIIPAENIIDYLLNNY